MHVVLLGDSVIDNGAYVADSELDVLTQVRESIPDAVVSSRAVDGAVVESVRTGQLDGLDAADVLVLSAGGNDALLNIALLEDATRATIREALIRLSDLQRAFRSAYGLLLDGIARHGTPVLVMTIYNPRLELEGLSTEIQTAAACALCLYNDAIQREANARDFDVLELRSLLDSPRDFANPVEPSAVGGAKIAKAIADWANRVARG